MPLRGTIIVPAIVITEPVTLLIAYPKLEKGTQAILHGVSPYTPVFVCVIAIACMDLSAKKNDVLLWESSDDNVGKLWAGDSSTFCRYMKQTLSLNFVLNYMEESSSTQISDTISLPLG